MSHVMKWLFLSRGLALLLSPERQQLRESLSVDLDLESLLSSMQPRTIKLALRDACLMTLADRKIDKEEKDILMRVGQLLVWNRNR